MSTWKAIFLFALLIAAVLVQVLLLGWGTEAVFFVTWFLLVLVVKHDTRLSPALGLVFLAACPFLLITEREPAAEQAANYAYFFLAIGVLVQVEEMVLERFNHLDWKVDLSSLWRPAAEVLHLSRGTLASQPGSTGDEGAGPAFSKPILISGLAGLALFFLILAFTGISWIILIPLLLGSVLFILLVWGLRLVLLALNQVSLARLAWWLVLLPFFVTAGIWVNVFFRDTRVTRMQVSYDFIQHIEEALRAIPPQAGEIIEVQDWVIGDESHEVLFQHPALSGASQISFPLIPEAGSLLAFDLATSPESWEKPGDGVDFTIFVYSEEGFTRVFTASIDPKNNYSDRRWHPYTVDLDEYTGELIAVVFRTGVGPAGDYRYDWAGWGDLRLLVP